MCGLIIPQYGASCSLHFDFLTSFTLWYSCYDLFEKPSYKNLKPWLYIYSHCCIISCVYIEYYLLTELLNSPYHYLSFQAYSLLAGHFCWTFWTCFLVVICTFLLCVVSTPKLWIYMNYCIKIIKLYYKVYFVISVALNSNWVLKDKFACKFKFA